MEKSELKIVKSLINELNENITYCHWKSNQHFDDALKGIDDLDILVDRHQRDFLIQILGKLNFKHFYTPVARTYVGIEDWLGFDEETGNIIHLHLHYNLVVGEKHLKGFHLPIEYTVLNNRRFDKQRNVYLSSYKDELLLLILRLGMKNRKRDLFKKKFEKNVYNEFYWLKNNSKEFLDYINDNAVLTNKIKLLVTKIYNEDFRWRTLNKLKKTLYHDLACYSQGSGIHNTIKRNYREFKRVIFEIRKKYINSKYTFLRRRSSIGGFTIAFLGSDGSGKSSSIEVINEWLKKVMDVRYFYLGSGDGNSSLLRKPLKLLMKIGRKLGLVKKNNNFSTPKLESKENKKIKFGRKIWIYTLSKERIKKLLYANRCKINGYVVITDRYPQSEFYGLCDGPKLTKTKGLAYKKEQEAFRIAKLCPPDLAIKLIVSPEEAMKRKPNEIDLETSKNLTERVKNIKFSDKTKCVCINADRKQDEVILDIKREIWKLL